MFRKRKLDDKIDKFEYSAWDNVSINEADKIKALQKLENDNQIEKKRVYEFSKESWETFYKNHQSNFFKDRKWIEVEFGEIVDCKKLLEIGCGVGNSLKWLFEKHIEICHKSTYNVNVDTNHGNINNDDSYNENPLGDMLNCNSEQKISDFEIFHKNNYDKSNCLHHQKVFGCDFSQEAINIATSRFSCFNFFTHDISMEDNLPYNNFDGIILIYTLSAIDPIFLDCILRKIYKSLIKGGKIFFRDYSFLDMVQLRYKDNQIVKKNFYRRNDGTFTNFFVLEEIKQKFIDAGFEVQSLFEDKRLNINRKRKLEMYRNMLQGIFVKK